MRRCALPRGVLVRLARADAFESLGLSRRQSLWHMLGSEPEPPLWNGLDDDEPPEPLPVMSQGEEIIADYGTGGLSLKGHPMALVREELTRLGIRPCQDLKSLPHGRFIRTAGIVLFRQRPSTAKGIVFMTLEDETGIANLIVRPTIWERDFKPARLATLMLASGRIEKHGEVIHVLVSKIEDLSRIVSGLATKSRDFR